MASITDSIRMPITPNKPNKIKELPTAIKTNNNISFEQFILFICILGFISSLIGLILSATLLSNNYQWNFHRQPCYTGADTYGFCKKLIDCPAFSICTEVSGCYSDYIQYIIDSKCIIKETNEEEVCCPTTRSTVNMNPKMVTNPFPNKSSECIISQINENSNTTEIDEFPWNALILYTKNIEKPNNFDNYFKCGGTLINQRYIVTTAACVAGDIRKNFTPQSIRLGEYDLSSKIDCRVNNKLCADEPIDIEIEEIIVHENFNNLSTFSDFDIALIRLKKYVESTKFVKPVCLPSEEIEYNIVKNKLYVTGWESTKNTEFTNIKVKLNVSLGNDKSVNDDYQLFDSFYNYKNSHSDILGSPLMATKTENNNNTEYWYLHGIVSYTSNDSNASSIYTNVGKYIEWIRKHLRP